MSTLRIAAAHIELTKDPARQAEKIICYTDMAVKQSVAILCFPELALGYGCDFANDLKKIRDLQEMIESHVIHKGICVMYGTVGHEGDRLYNIQKITGESGDIGLYQKIYLGQAEKKTFFAGNRVEPFSDGRDACFAIGICYDMHFPEIAIHAALKGAQLLFAPHYMPGTDASGRIAIWQKYMGARAYDNRIGILAVNAMACGSGGGAAYWNPRGEMQYFFHECKESLFVVDADMDEIKSYRENEVCLKAERYYLADRRKLEE